jgi:hypothetical protein
MKYRCCECFKTLPCVLEFKDLGDLEPNQCPFKTVENQAVAKWTKVREKKDE